jgi:hypothetical protein
MHYEARGLVDDDHVVVGMQHAERDILRFDEAELRKIFESPRDHVPASTRVAGFADFPPMRTSPSFTKRLSHVRERSPNCSERKTSRRVPASSSPTTRERNGGSTGVLAGEGVGTSESTPPFSLSGPGTHP